MRNTGQTKRIWHCVTILTLITASTLAEKGGANSGGGKPGGGEEPAPDPRISFTRFQGNWDLMVMNDDGSNVTAVVSPSGTGVRAESSWSPDGEWLAFNGNLEGPGVYVVRKDGTGRLKVASADASIRPVWSPVPAPDGNYRILFCDSPDGLQTDLYAVKTDGTDRKRLTETTDLNEEFPAWSRDAKRIAAAVADPGAGRRDVIVYDVVSDGSGGIQLDDTNPPQNLTNIVDGPLQASTLRPVFLDWARTSDTLVASVLDTVANQRDLWLISVSAPKSALNLTRTADVNERQPSWSPDDARIAYEASGTGRKSKVDGIHVMDADGSNATQLIKGADIHSPDWRR